jgi:hypothetical protein
MTQTQNPAIDLHTLDEISLYLLQDPEIGLEVATKDEKEIYLVNKAIALITSQNSDRSDWTQLKHEALLLIGSQVADVVSRIASAQRNPDIALSGLRDASEKSIELAVEMARQKIVKDMRGKFALFTEREKFVYKSGDEG